MFVNREENSFNRLVTIDYLQTIDYTRDSDSIIVHQIRTRHSYQESIICIVKIRSETQYQWKNELEVSYKELKYYLNFKEIKKISKKNEKGKKKKIQS